MWPSARAGSGGQARARQGAAMKRTILSSLLALSCVLILATAPVDGAAAATGDRVELTVGIDGGIVAPQERLRVEIAPTDERVLVRLEEGGVVKKGSMSREDFAALVRDVGGVFDLPVENPTEGEDIYGLGTGVSISIGGRTWAIGAPSGCVHVRSSVQPTDAQHAEFKRIVERITAAARASAR